MQQRRLRLGDILDDYCSRERRITNHVVVAMIDDEVKQTRCTACDADHEYKAARVPAPRRKRPDAAGVGPAEGLLRPRPAPEDPDPLDRASTEDEASAEALEMSTQPHSTASDANSDAASSALSAAPSNAEAEPLQDAGIDDREGPVHRRLIRATLPRIEGQLPERKSPDFTIRQPGGRGGREFDGNKAGQRFGQGRRPMRAQGGSQPPRFGGQRHDGSGGSRAGSGQERPPGRGPGHPGGPRGNRPGQGQGAGRGGGRKRGR